MRQHNSALAHNPVNPPWQRAADYEGLTADDLDTCAAEVAEVPRWWPGGGGDFHFHVHLVEREHILYQENTLSCAFSAVCLIIHS